MTDSDPRREAIARVLYSRDFPHNSWDDDCEFKHHYLSDADAVLSVLPECRCHQLEQVGWRAVIEDSDELVPGRPTPWQGSAPMEPVYVLREPAAVPYTEETPNG